MFWRVVGGGDGGGGDCGGGGRHDLPMHTKRTIKCIGTLDGGKHRLWFQVQDV